MKFILYTICLTLGLILASTSQAQSTANLDLLWEANTYTPPFYRGHSRPSAESEIKVVALPRFMNANGTAIALEALDFQWQKDGNNLGGYSGLGKNILNFTSNTARKENRISVKVSNRDQSLTLEKTLILKIGEPSILLYEENPLTGIQHHQAIQEEFSMTTPEMVLIAEPYFFSTPRPSASGLEYRWFLNNQAIVTNSSNPRQLTLIAPESAGQNTLSLNVKHTGKILQETGEQVLINFNQAGPNPFNELSN